LELRAAVAKEVVVAVVFVQEAEAEAAAADQGFGV
jgi:hypothetical protein